MMSMTFRTKKVRFTSLLICFFSSGVKSGFRVNGNGMHKGIEGYSGEQTYKYKDMLPENE